MKLSNKFKVGASVTIHKEPDSWSSGCGRDGRDLVVYPYTFIIKRVGELSDRYISIGDGKYGWSGKDNGNFTVTYGYKEGDYVVCNSSPKGTKGNDTGGGRGFKANWCFKITSIYKYSFYSVLFKDGLGTYDDVCRPATEEEIARYKAIGGEFDTTKMAKPVVKYEKGDWIYVIDPTSTPGCKLKQGSVKQIYVTGSKYVTIQELGGDIFLKGIRHATQEEINSVGESEYKYIKCINSSKSFSTHPDAESYGCSNYVEKSLKTGSIYKVIRKVSINGNRLGYSCSYGSEDYLIGADGVTKSTKKAYESQFEPEIEEKEEEEEVSDLSAFIGRKIRTLVDAPFGGHIKAGDVGTITSAEYVDFPSQGSYFCKDALERRNNDLFELMPEESLPTFKQEPRNTEDLSEYVGRYVKALRENPFYADVRKGEIGEIVGSTNAVFESNSTKWSIRTIDRNSWFKNFELLPDGYKRKETPYEIADEMDFSAPLLPEPLETTISSKKSKITYGVKPLILEV